MARKIFEVKVPKSTHWYFTIIVKELIFLLRRKRFIKLLYLFFSFFDLIFSLFFSLLNYHYWSSVHVHHRIQIKWWCLVMCAVVVWYVSKWKQWKLALMPYWSSSCWSCLLTSKGKTNRSSNARMQCKSKFNEAHQQYSLRIGKRKSFRTVTRFSKHNFDLLF